MVATTEQELGNISQLHAEILRKAAFITLPGMVKVRRGAQAQIPAGKTEGDCSMLLSSYVVFWSKELLNIMNTSITEGGSSKVKLREPLTSMGFIASTPCSKSAPADFGVSEIMETEETSADEDPRVKATTYVDLAVVSLKHPR